jgi:pimeloyl-ACP methyl ester carboxylesterase
MGGPLNRRRIRCHGEVLEYSVTGEGEPIVLMHAGVLSDWFLPVAATKALAGFQLIVTRRAGYVEGVAPSGHLSIQDHARHCIALLEELGLRRAHLCGHSSSALIALQMALDRPQLLQTLVLLEPAPGASLVGPAFPTAAGEAIGAAMAAYDAGDVAMGFERFMTAVGGPQHRETIERALGHEGLAAAIRQSAYFPDEARAVWEWQFEAAQAEGIDAPMLLVRGERTAELSLVPPDSVALLAAMVPNTEVAELAGASHLMPLEDPLGVAQLIAGFARRHPIPAAADQS